jgi:hypothetical protein
VPRGTQGIPKVKKKFRVRAYHPLWKTFPDPSATFSPSYIGTLQPRPVETERFGLFRFRSPLLTESLLISFPPGTEMFQFPGFASLAG